MDEKIVKVFERNFCCTKCGSIKLSREYHATCKDVLICATRTKLKWKQIDFDKNGNCTYTCEACGASW